MHAKAKTSILIAVYDIQLCIYSSKLLSVVTELALDLSQKKTCKVKSLRGKEKCIFTWSLCYKFQFSEVFCSYYINKYLNGSSQFEALSALYWAYIDTFPSTFLRITSGRNNCRPYGEIILSIDVFLWYCTSFYPQTKEWFPTLFQLRQDAQKIYNTTILKSWLWHYKTCGLGIFGRI